jgi:hypothetical protein
MPSIVSQMDPFSEHAIGLLHLVALRPSQIAWWHRLLELLEAFRNTVIV